MPRVGFLLLLLSILPTFAGVIADIPPRDQAVLQQYSKWEPTTRERQEALKAIQQELEKADPFDSSIQARQLREILAKKTGYRVQFQGEERDGDRVLICNFLPRIPDRLEPKNWRTTPVMITDGATTYWSAKYTIKSHAVRIDEIGNG